MLISFEYVPEHYDGEYPYAIIKIKKSQLTPKIESELREALEFNRTKEVEDGEEKKHNKNR